MKIVMIGSGYVGLVSGACLAELGNEIICTDNDQQKIDNLNAGQVPIYEPGLEELIKKNTASGHLKFALLTADIIRQGDLIFIAVGTPPKEQGQADLQYVFNVAKEIGQALNKYTVIVTKSTVPVGTGQRLKKIIKQFYTGDFDIASCPEFLREGSAIDDYLNADRVVIGIETNLAREKMLAVHEKLKSPKLVTNVETAEMIKYASNAFLATKISFINEIANVCENVGADVEQVAQGMGFDKRIGRYFLKAGIGYGGSCFPKDVRALQFIAGQNGYPFQLLRAVIDVNNQQRWSFYKKIKDKLGTLDNKTIGVWGVAFKPNTDDIRDSIAIDLIEKMHEDGAKVKVFDPVAMKNAQSRLVNQVDYCFTPDLAATDVDCLTIFTDWDVFKSFDLKNLLTLLKTPIVFDGRNCFDPQKMKELGFDYHSIGRS